MSYIRGTSNTEALSWHSHKRRIHKPDCQESRSIKNNINKQQ